MTVATSSFMGSPTRSFTTVSILLVCIVRTSTVIIHGEAADVAFEPVVSSLTGSNSLQLNHRTFGGNIKRSDSHTENWVALFCADWYKPCDAIAAQFEESGRYWERELNAGYTLGNHIRFARVNCAVDKPLCNQEQVDTYPTVVQYTRGAPTSTWVGNGKSDSKRLIKWLNRRFGAEDIASSAPQTEQPQAASALHQATRILSKRMHSVEQAFNCFLIVALAAMNCYAVRNMVRDEKPKADAPINKVLVMDSLANTDSRDRLQVVLPSDWTTVPRSLEL